MTEYICDKCLKNFGNKKDHLERHLNKKKPCVKNINARLLQQIPLLQPIQICQEIIQEPIIKIEKTEKTDKNDIFECEYCEKTFTRKFNLERHLNGRCDKKKEEDKFVNELQNVSKSELKEINKKLNLILKQNEELKKDNDEIKKENTELKKQIKQKKNKSIVNNNINIVNNNNNVLNNNNNIMNNNNNNNLINFNNMDFTNVDKKLFINPIMNTRLFGKEIILTMIENIYINENLPEYQNIVITDKNRGYVKVFTNGKWKTDNVQIINLVINGIIEHSKTIWEELNEYYANNVQATNRLKTSKKYINLCDLEYLDELEEEQENEEADNKAQIKRCKDFRDMIFKDTINLFHDNKNILLKPKKIELFDM